MAGPNPLLPKSTMVFNKPIRSSLKSVVFKRLPRFKLWGEDYQHDELGSNFNNMTGQQDFGRPKNIELTPNENPLQVTIESNRLIPNIVYLKDTTLLTRLDKSIN